MTNVGALDRTLRFILGAMLLTAPVMPPLAGLLAGLGVWKFAAAGAGLVMLGTAAFRFCPLYKLVGVRTCRIGKA